MSQNVREQGFRPDSYRDESNAAIGHYGQTLSNSPHYETWVVDIKRGEYYRFKTLTENMKEAYESMGNTAFLVFSNHH